ncbi:DNA-binding MarR family transcriptional regulator [Arthrobacter stackebrandtii]|uniref:DNA-binding MarR family transcriptional regulator n=1 Tax=Arthrobacter stackebrandtii TaxID=272161 RepID=A0ABS4YVN0_9MICC|nr:MarR family winged helix-turn-helix transcriptional regulator [Arthrobacter stackebrandtii]MBP2412784.1 DNA-binding MarR family transcriptional regulator [Arthrobacter stackebrandtii]
MERNAPVLQGLEYELMLFSRYYLRPHHNGDKVLDRSASVLLSRLENAPSMTLKELAGALRLDISTVHRQVAALLRQELLCYAQNDGGELARRVQPTPAGLAALAQTRGVYQEGIGRVIEAWPSEKRAQFLALLRDFNEGVEVLEGGSWPRSSNGECQI